MTVQMGNVDIQSLSAKLVRLAKLDTSVFDEVKGDPGSTLPALIVAVASTFLAGLGGWLFWLVEDYGDKGKVFVQSAILGSVFSVLLWFVWILLAYVILTQLFRANADWQSMLRTMGFGAFPLALSILMLITPIGLGIGIASVALLFGVATIAIQSTTNATPAQVLVANLAGFAVWAIVLTLLVGSDSFFAPGVFIFDAPREGLSSLANISNYFGL